MHASVARLAESLKVVVLVIDDIETHTPSALPGTSLRRRIDLQASATTVLLSGYFEEFLRDLAKAAARDVAACAQPFAALPRDVRESHFEQGGYVLMHVQRALKRAGASRHHWGTSSPDDIVRRLHSPMASAVAAAAATAAAATAVQPTAPPPPPAYELLWEAFVDLRENPNSKVVSQLLQRFGFDKAWLLIEIFSPDPFWTSAQMESVLNDLADKRNECAHSGTLQLTPDILQMRQYVAMLRALSTALVGVLSELVRRLMGGCGPELELMPPVAWPGAGHAPAPVVAPPPATPAAPAAATPAPAPAAASALPPASAATSAPQAAPAAPTPGATPLTPPTS